MLKIINQRHGMSERWGRHDKAHFCCDFYFSARGRTEKFCFRKLAFHAMTREQGGYNASKKSIFGSPLRESFSLKFTLSGSLVNWNVSRWGKHKNFPIRAYIQILTKSERPSHLHLQRTSRTTPQYSCDTHWGTSKQGNTTSLPTKRQ